MSAPVSIKWTLGETYRARLSIDDLFDPTTAFAPVHGEILAKLKAATALTKDQATWEPSPAKAIIEIRLSGSKSYETLSSTHRTPTLAARRARLRVVEDKQDLPDTEHQMPETDNTPENATPSECPDLLKAFLEAGSSASTSGSLSAPAVADAGAFNVSTTGAAESGRPQPVLPSYTTASSGPSRSTSTFGSGRPWGSAHARPAAPRFVTQIEVSAMIEARISELSAKLEAQSPPQEQTGRDFDHHKHKRHAHAYRAGGDKTRDFVHNAICDACDMHIRGSRYKCLECPDFDSCGSCWNQTRQDHPHKFIRVSDDCILPALSAKVMPIHHGVLCDGPLCSKKKTPITGDRFKCTICADYDHCAACEAHPQNMHSVHHAMLKLRIPAVVSDTNSHAGAKTSSRQTNVRPVYIGKQFGSKVPSSADREMATDFHKKLLIKDELKQAFVDLGTKMRTAMSTCEAVRKVKHLTVVCDGCDKTVYGHRFMCATCKDFDLCQECYNEKDHAEDHVFVQYKHFVNNVIVPRAKIPAVSPVLHAGEHKGYFCNECSQSPMLGKRYNCLVCKDYDACENCKDLHHFVDHPLQIVPAIGVKTVTEKGKVSVLSEGKSAEHSDKEVRTTVPSKMSEDKARSFTDDVRLKDDEENIVIGTSESVNGARSERATAGAALSCDFVEDISIPDGTVVPAGVTFIKQWLVRNDGDLAWPVGVRAVVTGGSFARCVIPETLSAGAGQGGLALDGTVQPGDSVVLSVQLRAPSEPQRNATTYFKLATEDGERFGCKLWVDVDVSHDVSPQFDQNTTTSEVPTAETSTHSDMIFPSASMELRKNSTASEESTSCAGTQQADEWHSEDEISLSDDEDYDVLDNESFSDEA